MSRLGASDRWSNSATGGHAKVSQVQTTNATRSPMTIAIADRVGGLRTMGGNHSIELASLLGLRPVWARGSANTSCGNDREIGRRCRPSAHLQPKLMASAGREAEWGG